MTYNVVAFDGGGSHGVLAACFMRALAKDIPGFRENVDLFVGTSIGAGNALAFAGDHPIDDIVSFYVRFGHRLFEQREYPEGAVGLLAKLLSRLPLIGRPIGFVDGLFLPKWNNRGLHEGATEFFGRDTTLASLRHRVAVTTLTLDGRLRDHDSSYAIPTIMHNYPNHPSIDLDMKVADAMMRSSAAPGYFPSYQGCVDGGLFANNPSMVALTSALDPRLGNATLGDIRILSIGAGLTSDAVASTKPLRWGELRWGTKALELSFGAVSELDSDQCRALIGNGYCRLNLELNEPIAFDDWRAIPRMIQMVDEIHAAACDHRAAVDSNVVKRYIAAREFVRRNFASADRFSA